jgi:uncharacterized protein GlcG (DUF336 family)
MGEIVSRPLIAIGMFACLLGLPTVASAAACPVSADLLTSALKQSVKPSGGPSNGGFDNNEWAAVVDTNGAVCAITFSGQSVGDQWLGSRAIAAEKATTANALSLDHFALSTANLFGGAQPGGPLFDIVETNPVNNVLLYTGDPSSYGTATDPFLGHVVGGVVVFGGGLALYDGNRKVGALGVSGDSSCADHNIAWRMRQALHLDKVPGGVSPNHNDQILYDLLPDKSSASGFGHAKCAGSEADIAVEIGAGVVPLWNKLPN